MVKIYDNPLREQWETLVQRNELVNDPSVATIVDRIIARVRMQQDQALFELSAEIDKVSLDSIRVSTAEIEAACGRVDESLKQAIAVAKQNITAFHAAQRAPEVAIETMPGVRCIQRSVPIQHVGLYIPGGSAPLFSTVLMLAVPAAIAGAATITLCSPTDKQGRINDAVLYAAYLCGVTNICKVGGAQAIAAMAYGTQSVRRCDKIFGPGNRFVTEAKQQISRSAAAIDMPAGPSEVMVMADKKTASADFVAADMLSQAEHGADSQAIVLTDSLCFAQSIAQKVDEQLLLLSRSSMAEKALEGSRIIVFDNKAQAIEFANLYAAEHLILSVDDPWEVCSKITNAGSIFIGNYTPESAGDYASGTNHTLPTYGWAHSFSGVNLDSFTKKITIQEISREGLMKIGPTIEVMAQAEGLTAHKNAVSIRLKTL